MEIITHNLAGIIIQIICFKYFIFPLNLIFTIIFAFFSHFLNDILSSLTYHTPESHWEDKIWVAWHIFVYVSGVVIIFIFLIPFWIGMLFAYLPDIVDWYILRPIQKYILRPIQKRRNKKESSPNIEYTLVFHPMIDWIRAKFFFWLPKWNYKKSGILIELAFIASISILIYFFI